MVAVIQSSGAIHRTFNYHENKVKAGVAQCILAENYPLELPQLSVKYRLNRLLHQAQLNENVKRNSLHISLNFAPGEEISLTNLKAIAQDYMAGIGCANQPYLVYEHLDAAHPHLHILTTTIRADGSRIDTHNMGRNQSEQTRKALEIQYQLVRAEAQKRTYLPPQPLAIAQIVYGKLPTKRAIAGVLHQVLNHYHYTSLTTLNAALQSYGVMADRGAESSRMFQKGGLYYRLIDAKGNRVGVPIKASLFAQNPGWNYLQEQFVKNQKRQPIKKKILQQRIDQHLKFTLKEGEHLMERSQIDGLEWVWRMNPQGRIYGLTFVDHQHKIVMNGSTLGKQYSAKAMKERLKIQPERVALLTLNLNHKTPISPHEHPMNQTSSSLMAEGIRLLMDAEWSQETVPYPLKRTRRRKKKRKFTHY